MIDYKWGNFCFFTLFMDDFPLFIKTQKLPPAHACPDAGIREPETQTVDSDPQIPDLVSLHVIFLLF